MKKKSQLFTNYDYTGDGPNETSPGGSPYHGTPGSGEKSVSKWVKKRRRAGKRKKKMRAMADAAPRRVKLAVLRDDEGEGCPFGLGIPTGCLCAGNAVEDMVPGDAEHNAKVLMVSQLKEDEAKKCPYAGLIVEESGIVNCNHGEPGVSATFTPSPLGETYEGMNGLMNYPPGTTCDYSTSTNSYVGQYSIQGADDGKIRNKKA